MGKLNLCVLFGGKSSEYDISLLSAKQILSHFDESKYEIILVGITKEGEWLLYEGDYDSIANKTWQDQTTAPCVISGQSVINLETGERKKVDVAFPIMHGYCGEDGTIQGLLYLAGIPYVGCGVAASACGLDKTLSKIIFEREGLPQVPYLIFTQQNYRNPEACFLKVEDTFSYPCFVKPASTGSSVGINKVKNREDLKRAMEEAFTFDNKLLVEEFIDCREIEMAVIGNQEPRVSECGEVVSPTEFYDFESKYYDPKLKIMIPAQIDKAISDEIKGYAKRAFQAMGCRGLSRVDFFINKKNNKVYLNEINTMPGFTKSSLYPILWQSAGMSYSGLLDELVSLALE